MTVRQPEPSADVRWESTRRERRQERPLRSTTRFRIVNRTRWYYTPFDAPLGAPPKEPPSNLSIIIGDVEDAFGEITSVSPLVWGHVFVLTFVAFVIIDYHVGVPILILVASAILGFFIGLMMHNKTRSRHEDAARATRIAREHAREDA
jgi:hypothetical protein